MRCLSSPLSSPQRWTDTSLTSAAAEDKISDVKDLEKYLNSFYQQEAHTVAALEGATLMHESSPSARQLRQLPNDKYQLSQPVEGEENFEQNTEQI